MVSKLFLVPIQESSEASKKIIEEYSGSPKVYVSLHQPVSKLKEALGEEAGQITFIGGMEDSLSPYESVHPSNLSRLRNLLEEKMDQIKAIVIDGFFSFRIYNTQEELDEFIKSVREETSKKNVDLIVIGAKRTEETLKEQSSKHFDKIIE